MFYIKYKQTDKLIFLLKLNDETRFINFHNASRVLLVSDIIDVKGDFDSFYKMPNSSDYIVGTHTLGRSGMKYLHQYDIRKTLLDNQYYQVEIGGYKFPFTLSHIPGFDEFSDANINLIKDFDSDEEAKLWFQLS